jgi:hypothetical protein
MFRSMSRLHDERERETPTHHTLETIIGLSRQITRENQEHDYRRKKAEEAGLTM